eukprot:1481850-Pleurochrysis_carterae.AAC.2
MRERCASCRREERLVSSGGAPCVVRGAPCVVRGVGGAAEGSACAVWMAQTSICGPRLLRVRM